MAPLPYWIPNDYTFLPFCWEGQMAGSEGGICPRHFRCLLPLTGLSNILNVVLSLFCEWKSYLSHSVVIYSRAGPMPLDAFLRSTLAGIVKCSQFVITLSVRLIEMRLLISSLGLHLQLNGWWWLGYGLINKFNKHELRIYDESDTALSASSNEMNGRFPLSRIL